MKTTTIFYSYTGITRGVAGKIQQACGGDLIEVKTKKPYSKITAYSLGCLRAAKGECDEIEPASIDVSASDVIVIGTPVWAFRAAPPINAAVNALSGCEGKKAVIFATCGGKPGETIPLLAEALEKRGVKVAGGFIFDRKDVKDEDKVNALINAVKSP
ncbi:flavodoxin family protein [Methanoplanus endosymbiosus]|uniref:ArsR family transcriptional regulator n=1 Tax=Methanoplanus endosymbiosus TaxID=33865 RepID=A0A9E7TGM1_9EURY|nr:flavodoxin [Methanoplanus endosymbiosus]UUX91392.1 ArsR family transcriptional regulator [Methanoplanus endosymbiosus]